MKEYLRTGAQTAFVPSPEFPESRYSPFYSPSRPTPAPGGIPGQLWRRLIIEPCFEVTIVGSKDVTPVKNNFMWL